MPLVTKKKINSNIFYYYIVEIISFAFLIISICKHFYNKKEAIA